jgi:hypothetical protein
MEVFIVELDQGSYGTSIVAVFSSQEKANQYVETKNKQGGYGTYSCYNSYILDEYVCDVT